MITLGACLCFKNSAAYLAEWLAYYRAVGVERFYLYDNGSTDDYHALVEPYLRRGLARLTIWPGVAQQQAMYRHCLDQARGEARWVAFLDDDEFLWPVADRDLPTALQRYEEHAGVAACWCLYGSSHHEKTPPGLVIENYTWRTCYADNHVKCIVCPTRVQGPKYIGHSFACEPGFQVVDERGHHMAAHAAATPSGDFLRVNHYATKSLEEVRTRRARPRADNGQLSEHPLSLWEFWARDWNQMQDVGILRYVPATKAILSEFAPVHRGKTAKKAV